MNGPKLQALDVYKAARAEVLAYFGYKEDWRVLPIEDTRDVFWRLNGTGPGTVRFAVTLAELNSDGDYYEDEIYTQRHLPKWVYRGADYTLIVVDTHTDGNQFLRIFDNAKER